MPAVLPACGTAYWKQHVHTLPTRQVQTCCSPSDCCPALHPEPLAAAWYVISLGLYNPPLQPDLQFSARLPVARMRTKNPSCPADLRRPHAWHLRPLTTCGPSPLMPLLPEFVLSRVPPPARMRRSLAALLLLLLLSRGVQHSLVPAHTVAVGSSAPFLPGSKTKAQGPGWQTCTSA